MSRYLKLILFGLCWAMAGAVLFLLLAYPGPGTRWSPERVITAEPQKFESPDSELETRDSRLVMAGSDANGVASAMQPIGPFEATDYPLVGYRLSAVPTVSRPLLLWRADGVMYSLLLPEVAGNAVVRPGDSAGWRGVVDAVGIAAAPVDYLPADAIDAQQLTLQQLQFQSESWRGALSALSTGWRAYRPWSGRSINTGGFELGADAGASLQLLVAGWCASGILLAALLLGRRTARRWAASIVMLGVGLLAVQQISLLAQRTAVVSAADALVERRQQSLAAQPVLYAAAARLLVELESPPRRERIMVLGEDRFGREYVTWLLRQHDVATVEGIGDLASAVLPAQGVLVLVGMDAARFDPRSSRLSLGARELPVQQLQHAGPLRAYRIDRAVAAP